MKKYFYTLRSLSSAKFVLEYNTNPPIEFDTLRNVGIPKQYNQIVDKLLDIKINNSEKELIVKEKSLDDYIETELKKLDDIVHKLTKEEEKDWNELNNYFKNQLKV